MISLGVDKMITKIGYLRLYDEFYFEGEKFKIVGINSYRSFNNVLCYNSETKKRIWLDQGSEVEIKK